MLTIIRADGIRLAPTKAIGDNVPVAFLQTMKGRSVMSVKNLSPRSEPFEDASVADRDELARLIERTVAGDSGAMKALYDKYKRVVFGLTLRCTSDHATAEDLLQDIFLKIFFHLGEVKNVEMFPSWIYRIALNTCYSHLRSRRGTAGRTVSLSEIEERVAGPSADQGSEDLRRPLEEAIRTLPEKLRSVFLLHDVQGFKHREISAMMGWSVGTSKSQLFKARMRLRGVLKTKMAL